MGRTERDTCMAGFQQDFRSAFKFLPIIVPFLCIGANPMHGLHQFRGGSSKSSQGRIDNPRGSFHCGSPIWRDVCGSID